LARALPGFARLFVRESRATAAAEEQATQEFFRLALHETRDATGVLIFVSLFERRVVVLADRGIDAKVGEEHWRSVDEVVLAGVAADSLCRGLIEGIERAGAVLSEHFPVRAGDRNELPDRVIVRRE
jgi:putative membrane protein